MKTFSLLGAVVVALMFGQDADARIVRAGACANCAKATVVSPAPVIVEHAPAMTSEVIESPAYVVESLAYVAPIRVWRPVRQRAVSAVRNGWWGRVVSRARTVRR